MPLQKRSPQTYHKVLSLFCSSAASNSVSAVSNLAPFTGINFIPFVFKPQFPLQCTLVLKIVCVGCYVRGQMNLSVFIKHKITPRSERLNPKLLHVRAGEDDCGNKWTNRLQVSHIFYGFSIVSLTFTSFSVPTLVIVGSALELEGVKSLRCLLSHIQKLSRIVTHIQDHELLRGEQCGFLNSAWS